MKRRAFIAGLGGAVAWPLAARAQQGERMRRVGVLSYGTDTESLTTLTTKLLRDELQKSSAGLKVAICGSISVLATGMPVKHEFSRLIWRGSPPT